MSHSKPDVGFLRYRRNPEKYKKNLLQAGISKGMKILDYGCGIGSYTVIAAEIAGENGSVVAADNNPGMLDYVKEEIDKAGVENVTTLFVENYTDIKDKDFDFIFLIDVLHHLENAREVINYMYAHLKSGGKLLVQFEHFTVDEAKEISAWSDCNSYKNLIEDYWLLE